MYVVEIKTSSKLELSTIIGEPDRIKKGKGQLYYTLNLLEFCKTEILVDFVFVKELQQQATRIRYYNIDEKVKDGNEELNPETWFQTMDRAFGTNKFDGNEDIMAWREKQRKKQKKNKKKIKKKESAARFNTWYRGTKSLQRHYRSTKALPYGENDGLNKRKSARARFDTWHIYIHIYIHHTYFL